MTKRELLFNLSSALQKKYTQWGGENEFYYLSDMQRPYVPL